ncbi:uncharacterized protein LOC119881624 isoform X4 [Canis lupus familiaris]|uniref:uncharacterized protein LOC119881624 isoform X4 n=1 Tax=Canis lupus familiaris TaxID=9615 RepID=UPI0015F182AE|nr:uncharacterized protein LOC119881624 isoform X4 [Canis lupus familiaris]XP_038535296.1 uncharacterized protein LOC119881624 isoform X4 [Canis lupus familiaris]
MGGGTGANPRGPPGTPSRYGQGLRGCDLSQEIRPRRKTRGGGSEKLLARRRQQVKPRRLPAGVNRCRLLCSSIRPCSQVMQWEQRPEVASSRTQRKQMMELRLQGRLGHRAACALTLTDTAGPDLNQGQVLPVITRLKVALELHVEVVPGVPRFGLARL